MIPSTDISTVSKGSGLFTEDFVPFVRCTKNVKDFRQ